MYKNRNPSETPPLGGWTLPTLMNFLIIALVSGTSSLAQDRTVPLRIVSVVPAITEMLFSIGAGKRLVGVSSFARYPVEIDSLPRVGALLDPDVEQILSLRPDLVILYGSQVDVIKQMTRARIRTLTYRHGNLNDIHKTILRLGQATGLADEAQLESTRIAELLASIRKAVSGRKRPRVLLVIGRDPDQIRNVYVSGGTGFLQDAIVIAGGKNVFGHFNREAVQPTSEQLLASSPDVIVEIHADGLLTIEESERQENIWAAFSSIPAVRNQRIFSAQGNALVVPGPRIAAATLGLAKIIHPEAFK